MPNPRAFAQESGTAPRAAPGAAQPSPDSPVAYKSIELVTQRRYGFEGSSLAGSETRVAAAGGSTGGFPPRVRQVRAAALGIGPPVEAGGVSPT